MSENIETLTDATFDEQVKGSDVPVLVDFWAEWCGPCKMISPVLEEIARGAGGQDPDREAQHRRQPGRDAPLRRDEHPDADPVQGRGAPGPPDRREAEGAAPRGDLGVPVGLPLVIWDRGPAVADVQGRLRAVLGTPVAVDELFGPATRAAVEAFQRLRGLRVDGVCGLQTWNTLVEAGFRLGDRFLYRRTPMLRGDDVAELQQRLCSLGFDTERVDGIFGDATVRALGEFQRNAGLPVDGIVGGATLHELLRLGSRYPQTELVSAVRARAALRDTPRSLRGRHVAVGEGGGLGSVAGALRRRLTLAGIQVSELHHPDDAVQAKEANELDVDVFVGLRLNPSLSSCTTAYWAGRHDESPGGRRLAELVQAAVPAALGVEDAGVRGMSLPILRETRMPAVVVEVGPASTVVERATTLAAALAVALGHWADASWD